jgi:hypothetical protein
MKIIFGIIIDSFKRLREVSLFSLLSLFSLSSLSHVDHSLVDEEASHVLSLTGSF